MPGAGCLLHSDLGTPVDCPARFTTPGRESWPEPPRFASTEQIERLDDIIESLGDAGWNIDHTLVSQTLAKLRTSAELDAWLADFAAEAERKIGIHGERSAATGRGSASHQPSPTEGVLSDVRRRAPGRVTGGEKLPDVGTDWFPPEPGTKMPGVRVARVPGQIARRLRGRHFASFDDLRREFWTMVAQDRRLRSAFTYHPDNLTRMEQGYAPLVPGQDLAGRREWTGRGSNAVYQLNHTQALEHAGDVFDLDNLEIVTPFYHQEIGQ